MLVNFLITGNLDYRDIEVYNLMMTLCLALYSTSVSFHQSSSPNSELYSDQFQIFFNVFYLYLFVDTLFIPNERIDRYLHHFLSYILISYAKTDLFNQPNAHKLMTIPFVKTELSTIFLVTSMLSKKYLPDQKALLNLSNAILFYTFLQYRIINLSYVVYQILFHYPLEILNEKDIQAYRCIATASTLLLLLNYMWQYKICALFCKHYGFFKTLRVF